MKKQGKHKKQHNGDKSHVEIHTIKSYLENESIEEKSNRKEEKRKQRKNYEILISRV